MSTHYRPRNRPPAGPPLTDAEIAELLDLKKPPGTLRPLHRECEVLWREHGAWAVAEYARLHPGRRPRNWWQFESPEPRARLGGIGSALHACSPRTPYEKIRGNYRLGIPLIFVWPDLAKAFSSGRIVGVDPNDPPTFEGQGTYLQRLGLFFPGEEQCVPPDAFEPEVIYAPDPPPPATQALVHDGRRE